MLSRCCSWLFHILGLSFLLQNHHPILLCPPHLMKPLIMFVLGCPSARKGTQCTCIVKKYGYTHLSAGELLCDERKNPDSQYGVLIEKYIKEGKIVPVEITTSLLKREVDQTIAANSQKHKFLIDGFPRNQDNLPGGKSSGRSDDNRESLEKRIQTYLQSTKLITDLYEEMGKVKKIDASKSVDEVFHEVVKIFDKEG
ncbi:cytidine monophosphate (UMP-CMP) kinase 1, cytosolic [Saguinus oedipus]|uniref:Cytidine monophosphate (UMP-CMP) kinase 1, cytosolic n=1 Tax=Saguinus oedipus TaxID=9490 RepID=A0ABQ9VBD3_SAGOE|nr:cytidine monophosphate (UMP-CMP) kinase 1, cytosolic [Saguinus oedipus]